MRLEVATDGRHITFLLVSLYEAGYGVQVVGSPAVFRELICLSKSAPIPFVVGGKEYEVGISITDQPSTLDAGRSSLFVLDYDFFSGLATKRHESEVEELTTIEHWGRGENEQPKVGPKGEGVGATESKSTEDTDGQQGDAQGTCAGYAFSNPSTSELARASENTSLTRSASSPATSYSPLVTAPEVPLLDAGPSTLDSSAPVTSYSPLVTALRAPYFMHPSVYHRGLHKRRSPSTALDSRLSTFDSAAKQRRRFRIGFFGTHDREFYTKHYHFPGMNRFEILEVFLQKFGNRMRRLRGFPRDWDPCEIAVSIDARGGDRSGKSFLSQEHYFEALQECDFVLSPPGICTPLSHSLIEAIFCGAIPITNAGVSMTPALEDGRNCLEFSNVAGFSDAMEKALAMTDNEILELRLAAFDYFRRFLNPVVFGHSLEVFARGRLLVNAEEKSVPFIYPRFIWPPKS